MKLWSKYFSTNIENSDEFIQLQYLSLKHRLRSADTVEIK